MYNLLKQKTFQILLGIGLILISISVLIIQFLHPKEVHTDEIIVHLPTNTIPEISQQQYLENNTSVDAPITRAQMTKIIVLLSGETKEIGDVGCFSDIDTTPEAPYICHAAKQGWVNGYFSGKFKPEKTVTKAEVSIILSQFLNYPIPITLTEDVYTDVSKEDWYAPYIYTMKQNHLFEQQTIFEPTHPATYGWLQAILNNIHSQT